MSKKLAFIIMGSVLILMLLIFFVTKYSDYLRGLLGTNTVVSEIKVIDGMPKIFVNGKKFEVVAAQTYNQNLKYNSNWVAEFKKTIDAEKAVGANLLLFHLWWDDLDKSTVRPANLGDNLDFTYLDQVMDYADQKGMKIMLLTGMHTMIPQWWKKEQGFPQGETCIPKEIGTDRTCIPKELCAADEKNCCSQDTKDLICCDMAGGEPDFTTDPPTAPKPINNVTDDISIIKCTNINEGVDYDATCPACETDNYGWKYNNPSLGYDKAQADYGQYLTAIINRYKNHPALLGWEMQLGFSGEDYYGPNYIIFQGLGYNSDNGPGLLQGKVTDYSEVFKDSFKIWLTEKYKTTAALQGAWDDSKVSFENFKIPLRSEFFVDQNYTGAFPDEGDLNISVALDDMTQKGQDFYGFRKYMKTKDSQYYSNLFKTLDPNHVLFFNAFDNLEEYTDKNINGYFLNNRLNAKLEGQSYLQVLAYAILAGKYGQLGLPAWENAGAVGINNEDQKQLNNLEESGKVMKCFGYGFGYVAALPSSKGKMPNWESENAKQAIKNIVAYTPTENCQCEIINNSLAWKVKTVKQLLSIYNITDYDYCGNSSTEEGGASSMPTTQNKCGDGVCDDFEKQNNLCSQDCK